MLFRGRQVPQERIQAGAKKGHGIFDNETAKRERLKFLGVCGDASQAALAELLLLLQSHIRSNTGCYRTSWRTGTEFSLRHSKTELEARILRASRVHECYSDTKSELLTRSNQNRGTEKNGFVPLKTCLYFHKPWSLPYCF